MVMSTDFDWSAAEQQMHTQQQELGLRERAEDAFLAARAEQVAELLLAATERLERVLGESNGTHPEVELGAGGAGHVFVTIDNIRFRVVATRDQAGDLMTALQVRTSSGTWLVVQDVADLGGKLKRDPCFVDDPQVSESGLVVADTTYLTNGFSVVQVVSTGESPENHDLRRAVHPDLVVKDLRNQETYLILPQQRYLGKSCDVHGTVF
jgi:hypothetical protein